MTYIQSSSDLFYILNISWIVIFWIISSSHLISSLSLNLGGHRGTSDDVATIPFHPSLSSAALRESPNSIPAHSLMLSSHLISSPVFFLYLSLSPAELSLPCQRISRCGHKIRVSVSITWLDHHALQLHSHTCHNSSCILIHAISYRLKSVRRGKFLGEI